MDKKTVVTFLCAPILFFLVCLFDGNIHTTEQQEQEGTPPVYAREKQTPTPKPTPSNTPKPTPTPTQKPTITPTQTTYIYLDIPLSEDLQEYTYKQCDYDRELYLLVMAIMQTESGFKANSIGIDGHDLGLMQIRDCNLEALKEKFGSIDLMNPYDNIKCGVSMIKGLYEKYEHKNLALMAYNCGEAGARKLWKKGIYSTEYSRKVTEYYDSFAEKERHREKDNKVQK